MEIEDYLVSLKEQGEKKGGLKVDFHNHGQTGSYLRKKEKGFWKNLKGLIYSEGFSSLKEVLNRTINSGLDILYITNFSDTRYEDWTSEQEVEDAVKNGYKIKVGEYYTFAKRYDNRIIVLGKSQEVPSKQGHVSISGLRRDKNIGDGNSLEQTLEEADNNELKITDHPYAKIEGIGVMTNSRDKESDAKRFDAFERNGNYYFPFLADRKVRKYSKKYGKPLIANADGHHPKDIGKTYNLFNYENLNYNSEKEFRDSIHREVGENNFETKFSPIPPHRIFHHIMMVMLYRIGNKISNFLRRY